MLPISETNIEGLKLKARGKVRDIYDLGDKLLIVATDRISAFDVVIPTPIPNKGAVLTQMSKFWFNKTKNIIPNHVLDIPLADVISDKDEAARLERHAMVVKKAKPLPVEAIVRGYITGSGWKDYQKTGSICGIDLPQGLKESEKLSETLFTPSTKAEIGDHDENISFEKMKDLIGVELSQKVKDATIKIYEECVKYAGDKGIIIADTKFEFGMYDGELIIIDEMLTPDSSRFWPASEYEIGHGQPSFDKQFVRDYLSSLGWNKTPPAPNLPEDIIKKTSEKYAEALNLLISD